MSLASLSSRRAVTLGAIFAVILFLFLGFNHYQALPTQLNSPGLRLSGKNHELLDDVANSTLGFQKIFIINLPSRTDRRDAAAMAAAFTELEVEFVDAVIQVDPKAVPRLSSEVTLKANDAGAWRSHMNVMRKIVEQNISSALVLEDDVDWDIRIRSQMRDFAKASRLLVQPLPGTTDQFLDPTWPQPRSAGEKNTDFDINTASTGEPSTSPYGDLDKWGMMWLGHCGCRFPFASDENVPIGRAIIPNDETCPEKRQINIELGDRQLLEEYPDYTRVVSRARMSTCTLAYGVSQYGARRILYELGVRDANGPLDMMYRSLCHGSEGRELMVCLSPQPALFNHHRPVGPNSAWSDISENEGIGAWVDVAKSENIQWGARTNLHRFVNGRTDYIDSYKEE